ncbi:hypothetical protein F4778DRAFT_776155 [Xylariomycetidae sp. FL2044]|nr:hypothetical protein F4778DRAFT_776155 [Xylariomycetidae sp. FL2044]
MNDNGKRLTLTRPITTSITGGGGLVGVHIVREALDRGYQVRLTARTQSLADKAAALHPQHANTAALTTVVVPDITRASSYERAFDATVTGVIHAASPFNLRPRDNVADLLEPAIRGSTTVARGGPALGAPASFASIVHKSGPPVLRARLPAGKPADVEPTYGVDGSKAARVLGLVYTPLEDMVRDTYSQLWRAIEIEEGGAAA